MHPLLFKIGPIPVHTYGFMIAMGFLASLYIIKRMAIRNQLDVDRVLDLTFWGLLVGFLGARTLFVVTRWSSFMEEPSAIFKIWEGGLVFYGGPIFAVPFIAWYVRQFKMPAWKVLDSIAPGLTVAHALGRFGCLAAGCCYGKPTGTSFGVRLDSDLVERSLQGIPLHPTQLYEAAGLFILLAGLLLIEKRKKFDGQVTLTYFMAYPVIRSIVEIFRGDLIRGFVIDDVLSTSQFISLLVFIAAAVILYLRLQAIHATTSRKSA